MSLLELLIAMAVVAVILITALDRWTAITRSAEYRKDLKVLSAAAQAWHRANCARIDLLDPTAAAAASQALLATADIQKPAYWEAFWERRVHRTRKNSPSALVAQYTEGEWAQLWLRHTLPPPGSGDHDEEQKRQIYMKTQGAVDDLTPGVIKIQPEAPSVSRQKGQQATQRLLWGEHLKC